jgi:Gpi18-like mannosyltransferase
VYKILFDFKELTKRYVNPPKAFMGLMLGCIALRLLFFISDGHNSDFDFFEHWAQRIVDHGFTQIYSIKVDRFECDYPPLYLYIIGFFGQIFHALSLDVHTHLFDSCLKLVNLVVELSFLWFMYRKTNNILFVALMLISPVSIVNAYGWGQIDILYSILIFLTFYHLLHKKFLYAAVVLGLSASLKTQTILFLPLIGLLFLLQKESLSRKLLSLGVLVITFFVVNLPFILYAPNALDSIMPHITAVGRYNNITVNAFNTYWTFFADFSLKMKLQFPPNDLLVFGLFSRKVFAYGLFIISFLYLIIQFLKYYKSEQKLFLMLSFFCFSYFMFLPEMHERYLFPMFIFSAWVCSKDEREWPYFIIISGLHCINLFWGWGEQKFVKSQWIFELTRIVSLATSFAYIWYALSVHKRLKEQDAN